MAGHPAARCMSVAGGSNKTIPTDGDVGAFLDAVADEQRSATRDLNQRSGQPCLAQGCAAPAQSVSSRSCRLSSLPPGLRGSGVALTATYCGILKSAMRVPR
jgi:hypothetical protein